MSWGGLGLILLAAVTFSSSTPYPGSAVALPVLGAALVIAGGVAAPRHGAEFVLRLRPCQWVGLISYSLYLWHWPVLTIAAEHSASGTLSVWDALGWELVSAVLAVLTYRLLENPIRHNRYLLSRRWASLALGGCLIASSFTLATVELHRHGTGTIAVPGLAGLTTDASCPTPTQQEVRSLEGVGPRASHRIVARILIVGDSTACTMVPGLEAVAAPAGVAIEDGTVIGCGVVSGEIPPPSAHNISRNCQQHAIAAEDRAQRSGRPNVVLWASTWERNALEVGSGNHQTAVVQGSAQWYAVLLRRMETRVRTFTATGATVVMLTQPAFWHTESGITAADVDFERLNSLITQFASHTPHVRVVNLAARVCPAGPPCPLGFGDIWVRGDGAHYTTVGALWVARWLLPQLGITALDRPPTPLPLIRVVDPPDGGTVTGASPLVAISTFVLGVDKVEFQVTGPAIGKVVIGPAALKDGLWGMYWNTTRVPAGTYEVRAIAYGSAGERSVSKGVAVRVRHRKSPATGA